MDRGHDSCIVSPQQKPVECLPPTDLNCIHVCPCKHAAVYGRWHVDLIDIVCKFSLVASIRRQHYWVELCHTPSCNRASADLVLSCSPVHRSTARNTWLTCVPDLLPNRFCAGLLCCTSTIPTMRLIVAFSLLLLACTRLCACEWISLSTLALQCAAMPCRILTIH